MSADVQAVKSRIWNGWSNNYVRKEDGYIIHMFEEKKENIPRRSLCGVLIQDSGLMNLNETEPGCIKCRRILTKRGLMPVFMVPRTCASFKRLVR